MESSCPTVKNGLRALSFFLFGVKEKGEQGDREKEIGLRGEEGEESRGKENRMNRLIHSFKVIDDDDMSLSLMWRE